MEIASPSPSVDLGIIKGAVCTKEAIIIEMH